MIGVGTGVVIGKKSSGSLRGFSVYISGNDLVISEFSSLTDKNLFSYEIGNDLVLKV